MSEFSESVYLRASEREAGVEWLRDNQLAGYVLEPRGNWVQVFPDWGKERNSEVKKAAMQRSSQLAIYYCFAVEQRWAFAVYQEGERKFEYECIWEIDVYEIDGITIDELAGLFDVAADELGSLLYTGGGDRSREELMDNAAEFADLLGLPNYAWASFEYADMDAEATGMDEFYVEMATGDEDDEESEQEANSEVEIPSAPVPPPEVDEDAPWQPVYELASHFLKHLHDEELIELTLDSRLARDRLVETLTRTVIENPISHDSQVLHHWFENLMTAPEIVDVFATDDMLADAFERAKEDVEASRGE